MFREILLTLDILAKLGEGGMSSLLKNYERLTPTPGSSIMKYHKKLIPRSGRCLI
jgi:hypothetical protein